MLCSTYIIFLSNMISVNLTQNCSNATPSATTSRVSLLLNPVYIHLSGLLGWRLTASQSVHHAGKLEHKITETYPYLDWNSNACSSGAIAIRLANVIGDCNVPFIRFKQTEMHFGSQRLMVRVKAINCSKDALQSVLLIKMTQI